MKRRDFIISAAGTCIALRVPALAAMGMKKKAKIGLITDLHQDIMHDGVARMNAFLKEMEKVKPDAIMQLGDFAYPGEANKEVIELFNNAHPVHLHVIGNHDTDAGYKKEQCVSYWGMPAPYYERQIMDIRVLVLDGNDKGSPMHKGGYPAYIGPEQTSWLKKKLKEIDGPIIIVSHQPLAGAMAVDNAREIQDILSAASDRILVAINGHTHADELLQIKHINYLHINSASYFWVGGDFKHDSYPAGIHRSHPWISSTCPYKEPLFTTMTVDPHSAMITIEGRKTEWVGKSPADLDFNEKTPLRVGEEIVPYIRNRHIHS